MHDYAQLHICALTHVYTDTDTCLGVLTRVHSFTPMPRCTYNTPVGPDTSLCALKIHAHLRLWCMYAHMSVCTYTHTPLSAYTAMSVHTCVHRRAHHAHQPVQGLSTPLAGSPRDAVELNWRRLFLLPLHPRVDGHPLSWQPIRVFLFALVFPVPQVTSGRCPTL